MVDSLIVGAALAVTSTIPAKAVLDVPHAMPTSLKTGDHVRVQTERRRVARAAVNSADTLDSIMPMLRRAQADDAVTTTKGLLDKTHSQIRDGRTVEAMLTIDQAAVSLERARNLLPGDPRVMNLDLRERDLRRMLNEPTIPAGKPVDGEKTKKALPSDAPQPVKPPKRDELPSV